MTFANYSFAGPVGNKRGGTNNRAGPTLWWVLHTSEGGEGPNAAENLASFLRSPGSGGNVASYQLITDTDRVLRLMDDEKRCHGAAGANDRGLHICFPGTRFQTRNQWLDSVSGAYIEQAARAVADWCVKYGIPPIRRGPADLVNGTPGGCDHFTVTQAFGLTDHTDVGPDFPWDVFLGRLNELLEEDDLPSAAEVWAFPIGNQITGTTGDRADVIVRAAHFEAHHAKNEAHAALVVAQACLTALTDLGTQLQEAKAELEAAKAKLASLPNDVWLAEVGNMVLNTKNKAHEILSASHFEAYGANPANP